MKIWVVYEEDRGYGTSIVCGFLSEEKAKEFSENRGSLYYEVVEVVDN